MLKKMSTSGAPRILIVEDEQITALHLNHTLNSLGYEVVGTASSAAEALAIAQQHMPSMALLDIDLPGGEDGLSIAAELKRKWQIPVVFLTAYASDDFILRAKETGAYGYLTKPFRSGELKATVAVALEQHRASQELRSERSWLTNLLANVSDGVIATDSEGRVTFLNAGSQALTGWKSSDAVGRRIEEVYSLRTLDNTEVQELRIRDVLGSGRPAGVDRYLIDSRSKGNVLIEESVSPLVERERIVGAIILFRDIRERVRLEQAQKLESIGLLAGGVAHDFNNLLTTMIGNASLATEDLPRNAAGIAPLLAEIVSAGSKAADLAKQLLAYAGKGKIFSKSIDISKAVNETVDLIRTAIPDNVFLALDLPVGLPAIQADATQIQQIVMNLVLNAAEALAEAGGRIEISTGVDRRGIDGGEPGTNGRSVFVRVSDTGPGMDRETKARIFDPFYTTKFTGRGLGLAAVEGIVRAHHGVIDLETAPGVGSTFTVLFPAKGIARPEQVAESPHFETGTGGTVLVVDDTRSILNLTDSVLTRAGYSVLVADSGPAAIAICADRANSIDLVLLDMAMPGMSGEAAGKEIRRLRPEVPICVMSGYNDLVANERFGETVRIAAFLQKPFTPEQLADNIGRIIGRTHASM